MSARRPIKPEVRDKLASDEFMLVCALSSEDCKGRIEWHHAETEAGKRKDDWWSILPLCHWHHSKVNRKDFSARVKEVLFQRRVMSGQ